MFKKSFVQNFEKLIEENCFYVPDEKGDEYDFEFMGFYINIETWMSTRNVKNGYVRKDGKIIIDSKFEGTSLFETILEKIESNFDKANEKLFEKLVEDLEGKGEMSQEFKDAKRLREIAKEAQQIHYKYSKKFFGLF